MEILDPQVKNVNFLLAGKEEFFLNLVKVQKDVVLIK